MWQLRDQDPLESWTKGSLIIIGDAAHAMLPREYFLDTPFRDVGAQISLADQGQGGGQSIEDAEALAALLHGVTKAHADVVPARLKLIEQIRHERASKIQGYSRSKAFGARDGETFVLNASQFSGYNYVYDGALDWAKKMGIEVPSVETGTKEGDQQTETHSEISPITAALSKVVVA